MKLGTKVGLCTAVIFCLPLVMNWPALEILRLKTFDAFITQPTPSGHFVVLDITEEDIAREGGWPFPRRTLASLQDKLIARGALGVGWVVLFPQPDRFGGDEAFAISLTQGTNVLAMPEYPNSEYPEGHGTVILGEDPLYYTSGAGFLMNIEELSAVTLQGAVSAPTDIDNLIRQLPLVSRVPNGWIASFATQVLKALTGEGTYQIRTNESGIESLRIPALGVIPTDRFGRKWVSWVDTPTVSYQDPQVEGKFVFVGTSAAGIMPQLATPVGLLNPHYIQAALAESLLIADSPSIPGNRLLYELGLLLSICILTIVLLQRCNVTWSAVTVGGTLVLLYGAGFYFIKQNILIDVTWSVVCLLLLAGEQFWFNFREQYLLRQQIKKQFEHYLDPRQVKRLQDNPDLLKLGGEKKTATFLFTDVRGFTSMSENLPPEQVTYIMNKALTAQQAAVQKHGGMVDKYIGDAMMAIFNAPLDLVNHPNIAVKCAKDVWQNMADLNIELQAEGLPPIAIGIGVNTGEAVIGNMGSDTRFDYTAIGDAVNTAARIESATKEAGEDILIGESTERVCGYQLRQLEPIYVKGKEKPLKIYPF